MSAKVTWTGMEELKRALRALPARLSGEAATIVTSAAESAKAEVIAGYPERTGNLRKLVSLTSERTAAGASALLKNTSPHAHLFEYGTQVRHTAIGANRGRMPPGHVFVPAVIRARRRMVQQLVAMVRREGFTVTDDGGSL